MDKDSIKEELIKELNTVQKEFNLPQIEIDKSILQFEDLIERIDNPELITRLKNDLIDSILYRANQGAPDTIPDELIVEDIAKQEAANEFPLKKIISGMQKNVDQYGIEAAKVLGLDYGGTVNKGFKVVPEGSNSPNFQEFVNSGKWEEIESQYYPDRTKANAQNADGTVWFGEGDSKGYGATKNYSGDKPWIENPTDIELRQWIIDNNIQTLNVAGNRSYGTEELGQEAMNTIIKAVDPNKLPPQGGSIGAAKLNDPNVFPEKIEEYDPNIHKDFKESVLDKMTDSERRALNYINNHPTMQKAQLNGESLLLGLAKTFGTEFFDRYNNWKWYNPLKATGKLSKVLYRIAISVLDPIGEGVETAVRIGVKSGIVKDAIKGRHAKGDSFIKAANQGRKAAKGAQATGKVTSRLGVLASNWKYELYNQAIWQGTAAVIGGVDNVADALNSVLDKYGLLPDFVKENIDVVPYEDLNKHLEHQARYWQSAGWQGSKLTSLWYNIDTMLPAKITGNTPHNYLINQKGVRYFLPERFELDADEKAYWDIITEQREFKIRNQDGFFGWWLNETEQTGQFGMQPSYFSQVNNPDLNTYNPNSHVDTWKKLQKIKDRFGPGIMEQAGVDITMYNIQQQSEDK